MEKLVLFDPSNVHCVGDLRCEACHYIPNLCKCGGVIHYEVDGDYDEDTAHFTRCDICGDNYREKI